MTRSTASGANRASPSAGVAAVNTRAPWSDNSTSKAVRTASLSSMTRTVLFAKLERTEPMLLKVMAWMLAAALAFKDADRNRNCAAREVGSYLAERSAAALGAGRGAAQGLGVPAQTVRVATDGDTAAARRAGSQAASCPMAQSTRTPPTR